MWFSTRGKYLAYATFNEKLVPMVYLSTYGVPDTMYDQYSRVFSYRYPKVLYQNSILLNNIINLNNQIFNIIG